MASGKDKNWQDNTFSIQEALSYMYKHSIFEDVTIHTTNDTGSSMCFQAHKLVLAVRSPVFADMFNSKIQNSNIVAMNISPRSLDILLWYMYSDSIEADNIGELLESFEAAVQYKVAGFSESCVEKLTKLSFNLSSSNVCSVMKMANLSNSGKLHSNCVQFIAKEPEKVLLSDEFLLISEELLWKILKERTLNLCPKTVLEAAIKWMLKNNLSDRKFLSAIDFALFTADDFLNIVDKFPNFFSREEIRSLIQNLFFPESSGLPTWCTFSKVKQRCIKMPSPSPYEVMEIMKENAIKMQVDCNKKFSKFSFFSLHGFQQDLLLKISVHCRLLHLVMMELAFGSDYVPEENLKIELRSNIGSGRKMQAIRHYLLSSREHYFLLPCNKIISRTRSSFNLLLSVEANGLGTWGLDGPISNQRYRTASVSSFDSMDFTAQCSASIIPTVSLKPFEECILFVDPKCSEKKFMISALYFDTPTNSKKYMTYLVK